MKATYFIKMFQGHDTTTIESSKIYGNQSSVQLTSGSVYQGSIISVNDLGGTCTVSVDGKFECEAIWLSGALSTLIGFSKVSAPSIGDKVTLVNLNGYTYILSVIPTTTYIPGSFGGSSTGNTPESAELKTPQEFYTEDADVPNVGKTLPADFNPGDALFQNALGVAMNFMAHLAQLDAGGLAKIEVHLINDMVRIVSNYFIHHSSIGDHAIYDNGRLNEEINKTSYPFEAEGKVNSDDVLCELDSDGKPILPDEENQINRTGRWRMSAYNGFLGDFIHLFVSDPTPVLGKLTSDALRAGKANVHINNDGTIIVQSIGDIIIRRAPSIIVPVPTHKWDSPDFDYKKDLDNLSSEWLKSWNYGKDNKDIVLLSYQLRQYARYLVNWKSLERFNQYAEQGAYYVPKENEADKPDLNNKEQDKTYKNPNLQYTPGEAMIAITRDGSFTVKDNYGSCIVSNRGNITISCIGNIKLEAGNNIEMSCKNFYLKAF